VNGSVADPPPAETAPWGELIKADIELEQPEEYLAFELGQIRPPEWQFGSMPATGARDLLTKCGLSSNQVSRAFSPEMCGAAGTNLVIHPDEDLVRSLAPETRAALYSKLGANPANHYMTFPFIFPGSTFEACFTDSKVSPAVASLVRSLLYQRGAAQCFSDLGTVMGHLTQDEERIGLLKALSRQSAVLARLRVRPETDIDKILLYWSSVPGVRIKDLRPLIESMTRVPGGSTLSVLYLLPQFARQRLYTFPMPGEQNEAAMDCHWSTMNFFNEVPDNRFSDPAYTAAYLKTNCYRIARPTSYGDIVLVLDRNGNAIHSAVYVADDLVFTKNGNNFMQPWMLTRLKDLLSRYELDAPERMMVWRMKGM
jgi:hypothetical protein